MAKKKNKKIISPIITLIIFIVFIMLLSILLSSLNVQGNKTAIVGGNLETSIVVVNNIFSHDGIVHFFNNIVSNFQLLQPLVLIIISLMAIGIGEASGLFHHIFSPLKKMNSKLLTLLVVFIGVISSFVLEYSYIILIPLVAVLYRYLNKNSVLGILTVFLGITLGYGTGLFYNYDDFTLGTLTQLAATVDVDQGYRYMLYSNIYIMIASTIILSVALSFLINHYLVPKLTPNEEPIEVLNKSKKGLIFSFIILIIMIIGITLLTLPSMGGILLDQSQPLFVAKMFGSNAPFNTSFIFMFLLIVTLMSLVYGLISKNIKSSHELALGFSKIFDKVGYLFVMMFLLSILIGIIDWTNIGVVVTTRLVDLLTVLNFSGIALIITAFIFIIIMSILMPNALEKWVLISPLMIPLFMRANMSPEFAQFLFKAADSIGKIITPIFTFLIVALGFIAKYSDEAISFSKVRKLIMPIVLFTIGLWLFILIGWYIVGLPLGFGTTITM